MIRRCSSAGGPSVTASTSQLPAEGRLRAEPPPGVRRRDPLQAQQDENDPPGAPTNGCDPEAGSGQCARAWDSLDRETSLRPEAVGRRNRRRTTPERGPFRRGPPFTAPRPRAPHPRVAAFEAPWRPRATARRLRRRAADAPAVQLGRARRRWPASTRPGPGRTASGPTAIRIASPRNRIARQQEEDEDPDGHGEEEPEPRISRPESCLAIVPARRRNDQLAKLQDVVLVAEVPPLSGDRPGPACHDPRRARPARSPSQRQGRLGRRRGSRARDPPFARAAPCSPGAPATWPSSLDVPAGLSSGNRLHPGTGRPKTTLKATDEREARSSRSSRSSPAAHARDAGWRMGSNGRFAERGPRTFRRLIRDAGARASASRPGPSRPRASV